MGYNPWSRESQTQLNDETITITLFTIKEPITFKTSYQTRYQKPTHLRKYSYLETPLRFTSIFFCYWSMLAFQCCVSLCCIMKWIYYMRTCILSLVSLLPTISPIQVTPEHLAVFSVLYSRFPLFYTQQYKYVNSSIPINPTFSFPHFVHTSVLYVCITIPTLEIGSSVPFFQIPYIRINI